MEEIITSMAVALVASVALMAIIAIWVIIVNVYHLLRTRGFHKYKDADKVES